MIRPPALRRGDVVRVVAPASPFDPEPFERGLSVLRDRLGLVPRMRDDVGARSGYLAGDDGRRLAEWLEAASDPEARAVWCARGGYGVTRLLPRLEAARLLHPPRVVVGFSDITALHVALNRAGLVTVHGPVVTQLGSLAPAAIDHLEALLFGGAAAGDAGGAPAPGSGVPAAAVIRPGRITGPLAGGNLQLMAHLAGTPFQPRLAGAVLFLEDVGERPYRLDRAFTQLRLSGALDGVAGVCLGAFTDCDEPGIGGAETMRRLVGDLGIPAVEGIPAGHLPDNRALPLGSVVTLRAPERDGEGPPRLAFDQGAVA
ncbi:MAG TPA: LD-carboxypeptidase [Anaeromyxobacteraceae bacterium]|nr:LD-carboxypeptidase [Anaeromyxobacteraceae bacterium]